MTSLIVVTCDVCGHTGRYKTPALANYHFPRHSCDKWLADADAVQAAIAREATTDRTPKPCPHPAQHQHGTYVAYTLDRCRCLPCVAATSEYNADLTRRHAYGQPPYVDADPVREHIARLRATGLGLKTIAKASGVSHGALSKLAYGHPRPDGTRRPPSRRVKRTTAQKILRVTSAHASEGSRVPAVGAMRRLRALVRLGWSAKQLAARSGLDNQVIYALVQGRRPTAHAGHVRAVAALYDELWDQAPPETNKWAKVAAARSRRRAAEAGWAPPVAWDDDTIDNPDASPADDIDGEPGVDEMAVERAIAGDKVPLTRTERQEVVKRLAWEGLSDGQIARRAHVTTKTVLRDRQELGLESRWAA